MKKRRRARIIVGSMTTFYQQAVLFSARPTVSSTISDDMGPGIGEEAMAVIQHSLLSANLEVVRVDSIIKALRERRQASRTRALSVPDTDRLAFACSFTAEIVSAFWQALQIDRPAEVLPLRPLPHTIPQAPLASSIRSLAQDIGELAAQLDPIEAGYQIGETYTAILPEEHRARHGIYYTPPALTDRLLALASAAGVDWLTCHVLDPACGGGAFLTPVARKIAAEIGPCTPNRLIEVLSQRLRGFEIDPFSAWMSQALLEAALIDIARAAGRPLPTFVTVCDSLTQEPNGEEVDLIIGNPPYGRLTLSPELRDRYERSLYGHANAYGIFTDLAVRFTRPGGVIAFVTPTSFLGGKYFKSLRSLLAKEAPPVAIDLILDRKRHFSDVLQETLLAVYRRAGEPAVAPVSMIVTTSETTISSEPCGTFTLPDIPTEPWLLPRTPELAHLVTRLRQMPHRLHDYGYQVSTGPLVWNRHKSQLRSQQVASAFPLIWAEAVTNDGRFVFRATKKNHQPFFEPRPDEDWLITRTPCVLVQRTTAKEQRRRVIAAELPIEFVRQHGAVVIENHLNMVRPKNGEPVVSPATIAALLSTSIVDEAFRCISGSVAVSASELEALPLPMPDDLRYLETLVYAGAPSTHIDEIVRQWYLNGEAP
jgi:adenine-specific DNA-methyltransferase